jgi:hypothetical protein
MMLSLMKNSRLGHNTSAICLTMLALLCLGLLPGFDRYRSERRQHIPNIRNPLVTKVRQIYTAQIGIREIQPNSGAAVEQYLKYVNLPKGNPWCAAFVCWVLGKAGVDNPGTGWSPALFGSARVVWKREEPGSKIQGPGSRSKESGLLAGPPRVADVFGIYFPEKGRIAHVGFIDEWDGTWLISVEGNTNESGSREGDGVYRKRRLVRTVYRVARYVH